MDRTELKLYEQCFPVLFGALDFEGFEGDELGYDCIWWMYEYVKNNLNQTPMVIDADDLEKNPGSCM